MSKNKEQKPTTKSKGEPRAQEAQNEPKVIYTVRALFKDTSFIEEAAKKAAAQAK